jgi:hypothetical protein
MVIVQVVVVDGHVPPHPSNKALASGMAVRVTLLPTPKEAKQVAPQSIPAGALTTLPIPVPFLATVNVVEILASKLAETDLAVFMVGAQLAPVQSPLQPVNVEFASGTGVNVTGWPCRKA